MYFYGVEKSWKILDHNYHRFSSPHEKIVMAYRGAPARLEIFTDVGNSYLLEFSSDKRCAEAVLHLQPVIPQTKADLGIYQRKWLEGKMGNYEYVLLLNRYIGKSFCDLENYPIFPWILTNYGTETLDFNDKSLFRDLSRPLSTEFGRLTKSHVLMYLQITEPFTTLAKECDIGHVFSVDDFMETESVITPEIIPELFSMPEIVGSPNFALPLWANSPMDFIYIHRKLLESVHVSHSLSEWITMIFAKHSLPVNFDGRHPVKTVKKVTSSVKSWSATAGFGKSQCGIITELSLDKISVCLLSFSNGVCFTASIQLHAGPEPPAPKVNALTEPGKKSVVQVPDFVLEKPVKKEIEKITQIISCFMYSKQEAIILDSNSNFRMVSTQDVKAVALETGLPEVTCFAVDNPWIVAASDSWIHVFKDLSLLYRIQVYRDAVSACAVSAPFHLIIAGTNDGSLIIYSCGSGAMVKVLELDNIVPKKIIVSSGWGFIISCCQEIVLGTLKHHILVHSVNGELLKHEVQQTPVDFWYSWTSYRGFDYLLSATETGKLAVCEVYYLEKLELLGNSQSKIIAARYLKDYGGIVIATGNGQICFIPYSV
jgi:hypothetical protein